MVIPLRWDPFNNFFITMLTDKIETATDTGEVWLGTGRSRFTNLQIKLTYQIKMSPRLLPYRMFWLRGTFFSQLNPRGTAFRSYPLVGAINAWPITTAVINCLHSQSLHPIYLDRCYQLALATHTATVRHNELHSFNDSS